LSGNMWEHQVRKICYDMIRLYEHDAMRGKNYFQGKPNHYSWST
jgi:hypothetical protein